MPRIYTKTGDRGDTGLFDGTRVRKHHERVEAYGDVDELNAVIGAAVSFVNDDRLKGILEDIQKDLFSAGAQLADPRFRERKPGKAGVGPERVHQLELLIDELETELAPLRQFILSGGGHGGALLHVARTVCRRAERRVVQLAASVEIGDDVVVYLNRLSDLLFVLARTANRLEGKEETLW